MCEKICNSKGGLTRHRRSKHNEQPETAPVTSKKKKSKNKMSTIEMPVIQKLCREIGEKMWEEKTLS
jgi:hypothetical protein